MSVPSAILFSLRRIVRERRGTRRESRFAFYTHPNDDRATHGALYSSRRKFDVLTVPGVRLYIYISCIWCAR